MAQTRIPGPECRTRNAPPLDAGTLPRRTHVNPGTSRNDGHQSKKRKNVRVDIISLQRHVRPHLYAAAYARAAAESPVNSANVQEALTVLDQNAEEYCMEYMAEYLALHATNSRAGKAYLLKKQEEKNSNMQKWHSRLAAAQESQQVRERVLNIVGAGLQTVKTIGFISAQGLVFLSPVAGKYLSWAYTGTEILSDVQQRGDRPVLLIVGKDVGKEASQKILEKEAEKASEHLAEDIERKALDVWAQNASKNPWAISKQTERLIGAFDHAHAAKIAGKTVGWAFVAHDIVKNLHETYEAWHKVFGHEERENR